MFKELKEKFEYLKNSSSHVWANDNWSLYRFTIFFFSARGQKRIVNFGGRVIRYAFRKILGIKKKSPDLYGLWMEKHFPDDNKLTKYKKESQSFSYKPNISFLIITNDVVPEGLISTIESISKQVYTSWELCICTDKNSENEVEEILKLYPNLAPQIKVVVSKNNPEGVNYYDDAFMNSEGEFIATIKHGDTLSADALYQFVKLLNNSNDADLIYSDEDKTDATGNYFDPVFKPDWCPDNFLTGNYIGNLVLIRKSIAEKAGGFSMSWNVNSVYDLLLRITELSTKIYHIPLVLYHYNISHDKIRFENKLSNEISSEIKALNTALVRRNKSGTINEVDGVPGGYTIRYNIEVHEKVSVLIPTKNRSELCEVAIESILKLTDYSNYEILLIDNNSDEPAFFEMVEKYKKLEPSRIKYIRDTGSFNFSRLMNLGVAAAGGKFLLLLNNDTEVLHRDWMTALVEQCQFQSNGVIGSRLLYYNNTIQHAGVIIGLGGIAGHAFTGLEEHAAGYMNNLKCIRNYSALTAACFMVRKSVYDEVGGFDELLAVDFNDVDFCLKVKEKGYNNLYLPFVTLYHYESISRGHPHKTRKSYQQHLTDLAVFKSRWQKYIDHDPCYNPNLTRVFTDFRIGVLD